MPGPARELTAWSEQLQSRYEKYVNAPASRHFALLTPSRQRLLWQRWLGRTHDEISRDLHRDVARETLDRYWNDVVKLLELHANRRLSDEQVLELAPSYFAYCRSVLERLNEPFRLPSPARTKVALFFAVGRLIAGLRGAYPTALRVYRRAWDELDIHGGTFDMWQAAADPDRPPTARTLHLIGLLAHEIANALAMAGDDAEASDFAAWSLACYKELSFIRAKPSVLVGILRAHVVQQQAAVYAGSSTEVQEGSLRIDRFVVENPELKDHYGLAKSYHFRALDHWFAGRYGPAIREARRSREQAEQIDPNAWRVSQRGGELMSWSDLVFKPSEFLKAVDTAWLIRDFGEYGRRWWQAISSATIADVLACYGHFTNDASLLSEARLEYQRNHDIRKAGDATRFDGITLVPSAIGLYEWLTYPPRSTNLEISHDAEQYVLERIEKADSVNLLYYRCLAQASLRHVYAGSERFVAKWRRADSEVRRLAQFSRNEYLVRIAQDPTVFAPMPA